MNNFEWLVEQLMIRLPDVTANVDAPDRPTDCYWLDLERDEKKVTIQWRPSEGFGFFGKDDGYGEGPEEIIPEKEKALEKLISLLS
jgi:hypothetical protein